MLNSRHVLAALAVLMCGLFAGCSSTTVTTDYDSQIAKLEARISELEGARYEYGDLSLSVEGPAQAIAGESLAYKLELVNNGADSAVDVKIVAELPAGMAIADPGVGTYQERQRTVRWLLSRVEPGDSVSMEFTGVAQRAGYYEVCVDLSAKTGECVQTVVTQPALACSLDLPTTVALGTPFDAAISVTNPGTGTAKTVNGRLALPVGLQLAEGASAEISCGDLDADEVFRTSVKLVATAALPLTARLDVTGAPKLSTRCSDFTTVVVPVLTIKKTGPRVRYIGQTAKYTITVANTGTAAARQLVIVDKLPAGATLASSQIPGDATEGSVTWRVESLPAGERWTTTVTLEFADLGFYENCATVQSKTLEVIESCVMTRVMAESAMQVTCVDTNDPCAIGESTTYVVRVRNEGKKDTTQVKMVVALPKNARFVSAFAAKTKGEYDSASHSVVFTPVARLSPGEGLRYRVNVEFTGAGDALCSAALTYAEFSKAIKAEEGTKVFEKP